MSRSGILRSLLVVAALTGVLSVVVPAGARPPVGRSALHTIPLTAGAIDPAVDLVAVDPKDHDLVLVQWQRVGSTSIVDRIATTGARLVQPLAPVSYLVWADAEQTQAIRRLDGVRYAGVLPSRYQIAPSVNEDTTLLRVTLVGSSVELGARKGYVVERTFTAIDGAVVIVPGGPKVAELIARSPRVYSVADAATDGGLRDERTATIVGRGTRTALTPNYRELLAQYGADGSGVLVSHVDGGVDMNHPELRDRIQACIDYDDTFQGARCSGGNTDDAIGHGTHTLGIVMGTGLTGIGDVAGFDYGLGVAPGAKAIVQNAIHLIGPGFTDGYTAAYREAARLGAIVSQNSWGPEGSPQGYDAVTREFDAMVRDVDAENAGDQPIGLVFSVMNGSGGVSTQGSPDEAKNIIGVGGTIGRGGVPDSLCTCSAHGPALDGRLLPTLVAPGQDVMSTRATQGTLCGLPRATPAPPDASPLHATCTGTSMASPHVSGAYAVFVDWYRDHFGGVTPSPALVKAALVNTADDLVNAEDADGDPMTNIPNNQQGWGRLNIGNALAAWTAGVVQVDQSVLFDTSGASHSLQVEPIDPAQPLKVTLVWTDALGPGLGGDTPAWINDLNLRVTDTGGTTWLGNVFANGLSATDGVPDEKNNIENVFLSTPSGVYTVTVDAANIIGDGLPNTGDATDQDFALVISNARVAG